MTFQTSQPPGPATPQEMTSWFAATIDHASLHGFDPEARHILALRDVLRRGHRVLVEWEEHGGDAGLGAPPARRAAPATPPQEPGGSAADARALEAVAVLAVAPGTLPTDAEEITGLITALLHQLGEEGDPAAVIAAAIELWAHDRYHDDPWPTETVPDQFIGLSSLLVGNLLRGSDRLAASGALTLLHLATSQD